MLIQKSLHDLAEKYKWKGKTNNTADILSKSKYQTKLSRGPNCHKMKLDGSYHRFRKKEKKKMMSSNIRFNLFCRNTHSKSKSSK